jgi:mRNA interferase MazF
MRSDILRGDVFWLGPAHSPSAVPHPCVVVQDDVLNRSRVHSVVVCGLTTNLGRATEPGNVLLADGEGGLPRQSVVIVSQVSAVDRAELGERIGRLSEARVDEILAGLRFQQRAFFRE